MMTIRPIDYKSSSSTKFPEYQGSSIGVLATANQINHYDRSLILKPITLPYFDVQQRIIQLWKYKEKFIGSVLFSDGSFNIIPAVHIQNPLEAQAAGTAFLQRIESKKIRKWDLIYLSDRKNIVVWPRMIAAAKDAANLFDVNKDRLAHVFQGGVGHFHEDTHENREILRRFVADPSTHVANDKRGNSVHIQKTEHGSMWAIVRPDGKIQNGGRGVFPGRFDQQKGEYVAPKKYVSHILPPGERPTANRVKNGAEEIKRIDPEQKIKDANQRGGGDGPSGGGGKPPFDPSKGGPTSKLMRKAFQETLQQNKLTDSYNASNPGKPVSAGMGSGGSIGGVASEAGIIEGLFSSLDAMEEDFHSFFIPAKDGGKKDPFSSQELSQILRELAVGIYLYDTVPFFSLHFNAESDLYPVIHPAYQNTLVGRVISFLDYHMKGFLNGGFYDEAFVKDWSTNIQNYSSSMKEKYIDLHSLCKKHVPDAPRYYSMKELIQKEELKEEEEDFVKKISIDDVSSPPAPPEPAFFSDYSGFRSSFRIIAKQKSFKKEGRVFELDGDFDVLYTIEPDEAYKTELEKYRSQHGQEPKAYNRLVRSYDKMTLQIKTLMPRLPVFQELFEQLNVISFFSSYFKTLKKAQKVPVLDKVQKNPDFWCPSLFPHLPIRKIKHERIKIDFSQVLKRITKEQQEKVYAYIKSGEVENEISQGMQAILATPFKEYLKTQVPFTLSEDEFEVEERKKYLNTFFNIAHNCVDVFASSSIQRIPKIEKEIDELKGHIHEIEEGRKRLVKERWELQEMKRDVEHHPKKYKSEALYKIKERLDEYEGKVNKIDEVTKKIQDGIKELQDKIQEIKDAPKNPIPYFCSNFSLPFTEIASVIEYEPSQEEREENQRIVGGCGLNLVNKPLSPFPEGKLLYDRIFEDTLSLPEEMFVSLHSDTKEVKNGHFFSLKIGDGPTGQDREYAYMTLLLSEEEKEVSQKRVEIFQALSEKNMPAFKECMKASLDLSQARDVHGASLLHRAASMDALDFLTILAADQPKLINMESPNFLATLAADWPRTVNLDQDGFTALHYAAQAGLIKNCVFLLKAFPKLLHVCAHNNATALHVAVQHNHLDIVSLFLKEGADPNIVTTYGMSPLYSAIHHGHEAIARTLVSAEKTKVDIAIEDGTTPLFLAIEMDLIYVVIALLHRGADVHKARKDGMTPFHAAFKSGAVDVCKYILDKNFCKQIDMPLKSGKTCLHLAAERPEPVFVLMLLAYNADIFKCGWDQETPVMTAIRARCHEPLKFLLSYCADKFKERKLEYIDQKNISGESALSLALKTKQAPAFYELLEYDPTYPAPGVLLKQLCEAKIHPGVVDAYASKFKYTESELEEAWFESIRQGQFVTAFHFEYRIGHKVHYDELGWSVPHYVAKHGYVPRIEDFLKENPVDIVQMTKDGLSIAAIAAMNGSDKVLKILLAEMLKRNIPLDKQYHGRHLILAAVEAGERKTADVLFYGIPRVDIARIILDDQGKTAAHYAAIQGDVEMLYLLLRRGANFRAVDSFGKTPVDYAIEYEWKDAIEFFQTPTFEIPLPSNMLLSITKNTSVDVVEKLMKARSTDSNALDDHKETPIFKAIERDNFPVFMFLCEHGASLDHRCIRGLTPFLRAAELNRTKYVSYLFERAAKDITPDGKNALYIAAMQGHEKCVSFLMSQKMEHCEDKALLDLVKEKKLWNICALLEGKGAFLAEFKRKVVQSIDSGRTTEFFKRIQELPLNTPMIFEVKGQTINIPLLHLIEFVTPSEQLCSIFKNQFLGIEGVDRLAKDNKGRSVYHVTALRGGDIDFEQVDPLMQDKRGTSLLHCCALSEKHSSEELLSQALSKVTTGVDVEDCDGRTPLFFAVVIKNAKKIELLLKAKANPNHLSRKRQSPFSLAVEQNNPMIIQLFLQYGASVNEVYGDKRVNSLHIALQHKHFGLAHELIDHNVKVNTPMINGVRPVHLAAMHGNIEMLRLLKNADAELDLLDDDGRGVTHYAAMSDEPKIFEFISSCKLPLNLMSKRTEPVARMALSNEVLVAPYHIAAEKGNPVMMEALRKNGGDPEMLAPQRFQSSFVFAAKSTRKRAVKAYQTAYIFKNEEQHRMATQVAIVYDSVPELKVLHPTSETLKRSVTDDKMSTVALAAQAGSLRTVCYLRERGVDLKQPDSRGKTPFEHALAANKVAVARYFLQQTDVVNLNKDMSAIGSPFLHMVCEKGYVDMAALLVEMGADVNVLEMKDTPLCVALRRNDVPLTLLLLAVGAEINMRTMTCIPKDSAEIQALIKQYGSSKQYMESHGETILHTAIRLGVEDHFALLTRIENIVSPNKEGITPLQLAVELKKPQFVRMLQEAGDAAVLRSEAV